MKYFKVALIFWATAGIGGCEVEVDLTTEKSSPELTEELTVPIKDQHVSGVLLGNKFSTEQAEIRSSALMLREGEGYWGDASIEVQTFDNEGFEGKTFTSVKSFGRVKPHIKLSLKKEGEYIADTITLENDYELVLVFGQKTDLGIPFSIRLSSPENETSIEGKSFATFGDLKVVDGAVDTQFDSFDTLEYLAKQYIAEHLEDSELGEKFGIGFTSYGKEYPKSGFVGYEATTSSGELSIIKIQLGRDQNGWKVTNQLDINQIHQAHPVVTYDEGSYRTIESFKARKAAAQKLETELIEQGIIESVRSTSMRCYLTGEAHKASCSATYGLKLEGKLECHDKNYLFTNDGSSWEFESLILDNQKMDHTSGELITQEPADKKKDFLNGLISNC